MEDFDNKMIGIDLIGVGVVAEVVAFVGIDANEAETSTEALGSINFDEHSAFITTADLGFLGLAAAGVAVGSYGLKKLFGRSKVEN